MPDIFKYSFNDSIAYSSEELVFIFRQLSDKIDVLHAYSSEDFNLLSNHIKQYYDKATSIAEIIPQLTVTTSKPHYNLSHQAQNSLKSISVIITNLQFHDIIRQKLEHIQQTNEYIIEELLSGSQENVQSNTKEASLSVIPDITRLYAAQLAYTNLEYQHAFADIKTNLQSIKQNTASVSDSLSNFGSLPENKQDFKDTIGLIVGLTNTLTIEIKACLTAIRHCASFEKLVEEINKQLTGAFPNTSVSKNNYSLGANNQILKQLRNTYTMESERVVYNQVFYKEIGTDKNSQQAGIESDHNLELF